MAEKSTSRKRILTGSTLYGARFPNRVMRRIKPAARKLGITKNGLIVRAVEQLIDRTLAVA